LTDRRQQKGGETQLQAGRDIILQTGLNYESVKDIVETQADLLRQELTVHARSLVNQRLGMLSTCWSKLVVTANRRKVAEQVASRVPGLSVDDALSAPFLAIGTHDEIAGHLQACRESACTVPKLRPRSDGANEMHLTESLSGLNLLGLRR
jgi:hypothetical protein